MRPVHVFGILAAGALVAVSGCGSPAPPAGAKVTVAANDSGCLLGRTDMAAGVTTFVVTNTGTKITEFYVFKGDKALGEVENVSPGTSRELSVELTAGSYVGVCKPGMAGNGIRSAFTVTGSAAARSQDQALAQAVTTYQGYVKTQVTALVAGTKEFTDAVRAGDLARAKSLYAQARVFYERVEPVAESFGDLDPAIDAREGDVDPGAEWTGFHVLEKHLWADGKVDQDTALADRLDADVNRLAAKVATLQLTPLEIANGAKELLDEVATSKITGEEDRYSHTDLWDFAANVDGVKAAVDALRPALAQRDAALLATVDDAYGRVEAALARHRAGSGWVLYTTLGPADTKALSDAVSGLAEPVSRLTATVAGPAPAAS